MPQWLGARRSGRGTPQASASQAAAHKSASQTQRQSEGARSDDKKSGFFFLPCSYQHGIAGSYLGMFVTAEEAARAWCARGCAAAACCCASDDCLRPGRTTACGVYVAGRMSVRSASSFRSCIICLFVFGCRRDEAARAISRKELNFPRPGTDEVLSERAPAAAAAVIALASQAAALAAERRAPAASGKEASSRQKEQKRPTRRARTPPRARRGRGAQQQQGEAAARKERVHYT